jgi:hypothetical protein
MLKTVRKNAIFEMFVTIFWGAKKVWEKFFHHESRKMKNVLEYFYVESDSSYDFLTFSYSSNGCGAKILEDWDVYLGNSFILFISLTLFSVHDYNKRFRSKNYRNIKQQIYLAFYDLRYWLFKKILRLCYWEKLDDLEFVQNHFK